MIKILVFPCGSEIGLEVYRALQYSTHVHLVGSSSTDDHGKFVYQNYIGGLPFVHEEAFIPSLRTIVQENAIDAIYPTMDSVIAYVKANEEQLGCKVIASEALTTAICLSKKKTYALLKDAVNTPFIYENLEEVKSFPVFLKPEIGYGSRGTKKAETFEAAKEHLKSDPTCLILEYLPGKEYTVDCFTNYKGDLMFVGPRQRQRISNGIAVNTTTMVDNLGFEQMASLINSKIKLNGAWFLQVKERIDGTLVLIEIASRFAGSSAVYRAQGVNFALLSVFNAFEIPVSIQTNQYTVTLDRALHNRYTITPLSFSKVYVDFDDTVIIRQAVNTELVKALYHFINQGKTLHLVTKHIYNIQETLTKYRLQGLFDEVILLNKTDQKYLHIDPSDSIYIDDSFAERNEVKEKLGIPVFSPDMVEALI